MSTNHENSYSAPTPDSVEDPYAFPSAEQVEQREGLIRRVGRPLGRLVGGALLVLGAYNVANAAEELHDRLQQDEPPVVEEIDYMSPYSDFERGTSGYEDLPPIEHDIESTSD